MLAALGLPPLDLPALLRFGITALALVCGLLFLVRNAASRYFVVDAGFGDADPGGYEGRVGMPVGDGTCFVCGRPGTKQCARCKSVRYCSQECQARHWKDGHKLKCKEPRLLDDSLLCRTSGRRKTSSISLVPTRGSCKVLKQPNKILFPYDEFVKLFNWDKHTFPPCGLLNCGNSCFANVVLQCLAFTRPLVAYLLDGSHLKTCSRNDWCFLCELQVHVQKVSQSRKPFSPVNILSRLPKIGGNFGHGRQEDAHEFMRFAVDMMQSVCLDEFGGEKALDMSIQETTLIQHIFGGHLQSQVKCTKCDKVSNRYENMMDLTVEIQGDAESLEECLDQFTGKEWLDGENMYKCDGCDQYVKAWKRLTVHQPPNILTVALKRFQSGRFGKLNKRVTFPVTLDLGPYMSGSGDGTDLYTLYAVVVHIDMLNASFFGHYICYTKDFYGNWYRIDDCKVMKVDVEEVLAQGAYMLLYNRINVRQPFIKHPDSSKSTDELLVEVAPVLPGNFVLTEPMESELEVESSQREAENLDLHMPARIDGDPVNEEPGEESGDVGSNVPQNMDLDESQNMDVDEPQECEIFKAVADDVNTASPEEFEEEPSNFHTPVDYHFMKENGPINTSEEFFKDAAKTLVGVFIPALHEMPEPVESNHSGPRSYHVTPADGSLDLEDEVIALHNSVSSSGGQEDLGSLCTDGFQTLVNHHFMNENDSIRNSEEIFNNEAKTSIGVLIPALHEMPEPIESNHSDPRLDQMAPVDGSLDVENRVTDWHDGFSPSGGQEDLGSLCTNSTSTGELKQLSTDCCLEKNFKVKEGADLENGVSHYCGHSNCSQLELECGHDNSNSSENLKPLFSPGFLDNLTQKKSPNGKLRTMSHGVDLPGNKFTGTMKRTPLNNSNSDYNCNGLFYESEKLNSKGTPTPLFPPGFLNGAVQKAPPNGKAEIGSRAVGFSDKISTEIGQDFHRNDNGCNGILSESDKSSSVRQSKPLFYPGFLDHHAEKRPLKGKAQKQSWGMDNGNCVSSSYAQS